MGLKKGGVHRWYGPNELGEQMRRDKRTFILSDGGGGVSLRREKTIRN